MAAYPQLQGLSLTLRRRKAEKFYPARKVFPYGYQLSKLLLSAQQYVECGIPGFPFIADRTAQAASNRGDVKDLSARFKAA